MMARYFLLFLCIHFCLPSAIGQNVTLKGKADSSYLSQASTIYAYTYEDYISYREKEVAQSPLDPKGNFSLSFSISSPTYIFLMVDNAKAEMVAEPGKAYEINFLPKDSNAVNTLSISVPVELEFTNSNDSELNYLLADFRARYENFLEHSQGLISKKSSAIYGRIDTMKMLCKKKYSPYNNTYLNNTIDYTFASLISNIALTGSNKVFMQYLNRKPIQLSNYDYMTFFHQFFSMSVSQLMSNSKTVTEVGKQNFSSLLDYFKQDKFLENDTLREAVLLKALSEYMRYPAYKVNAVLELLNQAGKQCKNENNRIAASNLQKRLSVMNAGKPVSQMEFTDEKGKTLTLSDFKGKYIYLNFWASWCSSCTQEMTLIPDLKKIYGGKIVFVSISVDKKYEDMKNFLAKNPKLDPGKNGGGWSYLHCNDYQKVKREFNVLTVPTYYIIDPKGNVFKSPAKKPMDIEPDFIQIKKKK